MTKIWVTKYALTSGVFTVTAEISNGGDMANYKRKGATFREFAHGKDFHLTEECAKARFEEMRRQKQVSLAKQKAKLDSLNFSVTEG